MQKKELRKIPVPDAAYERLKEAADRNERVRFIAVADKTIAGNQETLVLNLYQISGKTRSDISLEFRTFCQKDDYITLEVKSEKTKWRTGSLLSVTCGDSGYPEYWWSTSTLGFMDDDDRPMCEKLMTRWIGSDKSSRKWKNPFDCIEEYQNNIQRIRLAKKHKKITDVIDAEMLKFGSIPNDYRDFEKVRLFAEDNYLFFNKKEKICYCSNCEKEFDITPEGELRHRTIGVWSGKTVIRHGEYGVCPYCNRYEKFISEGYPRGKLFSVKWSVLVQKSENREVLVRYFCHTKDFSENPRNPEYQFSEQFRAVHTDKGQKDYEWNKFKMTGKVRWIYQRENYSCYFAPSELVLPRTITLYNQDINQDLSGTCMEYSCAEQFFDYIQNNTDNRSPWVVDQYFSEYRKRPWVEQLIKCGFTPLVYEIFREYKQERVDFKNGRTICDTLGISKNMLNMLREVNIAKLKDVEILKWFVTEAHREPTKDEFTDLRYVQDNGYYNMYKKFIEAMKFTTIHKLIRYTSENGITHLTDYFDYLSWMEEMGYDMKNSFNLFPKDFKAAHDEKSKEYMKFKGKRAREDLKRFNKLLSKLRKSTDGIDAMNIKVNGLFVRMPFELDELKREGESLHHCVGTYRERVASGKTMIFFIRKLDEPDKPYYTMEWNGRVVQCRGMKNCDMTPEVKAFTQLFEEKMLEKPEKSKAVEKLRRCG